MLLVVVVVVVILVALLLHGVAKDLLAGLRLVDAGGEHLDPDGVVVKW